MAKFSVFCEPIKRLDKKLSPISNSVIVELPLEYMDGVLTAVLEMILNVRSEGKRVVGDTDSTTKSLQKIIKRKVMHPIIFSYDAIADDYLSYYLASYCREFKENLTADGIVNADKIYLNFFSIDDLKKKSTYVWETWIIEVIINPMRTAYQVERDLKYLATVISESIVVPLPHTTSLGGCEQIFESYHDQAWLYLNYIRQGSNFSSDNVFHVNTNIENISKILSIIFESILYFRCTSKLTRCDDGRYKSDMRPFSIETVSEFDISYPRICCEDLQQLLQSQIAYCLTYRQNLRSAGKFEIYLSFYRLKQTEDMYLTRKICERFQIVCHIKPGDMSISSNLPYVLLYLGRKDFPDSLQVSPTLEYEELYKHYFTTMAACTPPRFYIHT
ncbi:hypothetical protein Ahia01_000606300 [Argonauta hians]